MVGWLLLSPNMDAEIKEEFAAVAESLRDDISIIAEGLIELDAKVETIRDSG